VLALPALRKAARRGWRSTGSDGMLRKMEQLPNLPEAAAVEAAHQAALEDHVRGSGLPLLGLAEPAPLPRMLGDAAVSDGVTESVGLAYGDPMQPDGPLVQVHCARWQDSTVPPDLRDLLEQELDRIGDDSPVQEADEQVTLTVDGRPSPAVVLRAGPRFWAARCAHDGAEVTVVARDWELGSTRLVSVPDVEPFLQGRRAYLAELRAAPPAPPAPVAVDVATAHRTWWRRSLPRRGRTRRVSARGGVPGWAGPSGSASCGRPPSAPRCAWSTRPASRPIRRSPRW
jgi:hypothetical protein